MSGEQIYLKCDEKLIYVCVCLYRRGEYEKFSRNIIDITKISFVWLSTAVRVSRVCIIAPFSSHHLIPGSEYYQHKYTYTFFISVTDCCSLFYDFCICFDKYTFALLYIFNFPKKISGINFHLIK